MLYLPKPSCPQNQLPGIPGVPFRNTARILEFRQKCTGTMACRARLCCSKGSHSDQVACSGQILSVENVLDLWLPHSPLGFETRSPEQHQKKHVTLAYGFSGLRLLRCFEQTESMHFRRIGQKSCYKPPEALSVFHTGGRGSSSPRLWLFASSAW